MRSRLVRAINIFIIGISLSCLSFDADAILVNGASAIDGLGQFASVSSSATVVYTTSGTNNNNGTTISALGFSNPVFSAIDPVHHRFFVADAANRRVLVYNLKTDNSFNSRTASNVIGQSGFTTNTNACTQAGMNTPNGLAYDAVNDRLFVADEDSVGDTGNFRILVYSTSTITNGMNASYVLGQPNFTTCTSPGGSPSQSNFFTPQGLAYDSANSRLFVADLDPTYSRVLVFNVAPGTIANNMNASYVLGQTSFTATGASAAQNHFYWPTGPAYDPVYQRLFVPEAGNNRVTVFNVAPGTIASGENASYVLGQSTYTAAASGLTQNKMNYPSSSSFDPNSQRLFVSDANNNRILVFNVRPSNISNNMNASFVLGQSNFTSGGSGTTASTLKTPTVIYDPGTTHVFVVDSANNRVVIFDGTYLDRNFLRFGH